MPSVPRVPVMYYLPKIHKNLLKPPGRPIISGIDSVTARIGRYVDDFLQPLVTATPSYLKDTTQVINLLGECEWRAALWRQPMWPLSTLSHLTSRA